jgi:hypothetical protein
MATEAQIAQLREMIAELEDVDPYSDETLGAQIDAATSMEALASSLWQAKAAQYAGLVNVSESGSSRALSDLHKNALAMARSYRDVDPAGATSQQGTRISKLRRS